MDKWKMYKKLVHFKNVHNKNYIILTAIIGVLFFLFLLPMFFIFKVFMTLASIALGVRLWDKWHTFFQKKKSPTSKRQLSSRTQSRVKHHQKN
jgi:hypothetical protein